MEAKEKRKEIQFMKICYDGRPNGEKLHVSNAEMSHLNAIHLARGGFTFAPFASFAVKD